MAEQYTQNNRSILDNMNRQQIDDATRGITRNPATGEVSSITRITQENGQMRVTITRPTVIDNTELTATGAQINTIQGSAVTYYIRFDLGTAAALVPYVFVQNTIESPTVWSVVDVNRTIRRTGRTVLPISQLGEYRLYLKEPETNPAIGSTFIIPMHSLADGTDSTHEVQPFLALVVSNGTQANTINITTSLPNTLNRITTGTHRYPTMNRSYIVESQYNSSNNPKILTINYTLTPQLWADISKAYGSHHTLIRNSDHRTVLELIYNEGLTTGTGTQRILRFNDGDTERVIDFEDTSTANAMTMRTFSSETTNITANEAIRRTHPSVFIYWLQVMRDFNMTYTRVNSTWRPNYGSTRHRYSVALDFNKITALVPSEHNLQDEVTITIRNDNRISPNEVCDPRLNTRGMNANRIRKIEFSRRLFIFLAQERLARRLGWLGGPWTLYYDDNVINVSTAHRAFIELDSQNVHLTHIHLSVGVEQD